MKKYVCLILSAILMILCVSCGDIKNELQYKWNLEDGYIMFTSDDEVYSHDGYCGTYNVEGKTLTVTTQKGKSFVYSISIDNNTLTLTGINGNDDKIVGYRAD